MKREAVNPTEWGLAFSMNQAEVVEGITRYLHCSGQVALESDAQAEMGIRVVAEGDMRGQIEASLKNIDALLAGAGMERANVLSLRFFTTDVDAFLENYDVYAGWVGEAGIMPPQTLLGVNRLALPGLLVEIEASTRSCGPRSTGGYRNGSAVAIRTASEICMSGCEADEKVM